MVTAFQEQVGVPVVASAIVAAAVMVIDGRFGPPPLVLPFKYGAIDSHPLATGLTPDWCRGNISGKACRERVFLGVFLLLLVLLYLSAAV